ncbi:MULTISPECIES: MATE family efflux transporter [unclassified Oleiphilus]|jgi:putative MATE family efflux protein|uniref:MATE family efflux transporter n=2 Tax=Oleiphilus TaxID=141450 RepID=UPI000838956D|nr:MULTISPECIES: MATE family efflux transporter [unclassified Oleiphilus]
MSSNTQPNKIDTSGIERAEFKELVRMTWPMLIGIISLMSFQLVDSVFIARLGVAPLAVVGFTIPIYQLFIGIQVGIGIATTALISQLLGANKEQQAKELAGLIVLIGSVVFAVLALITWLFRAQIVQMLGGTPELMPYVDEFWAIWLVGAFFGAFVYFGYSICRANGNTLLPGFGMVATSLINIALDPLYIFVFDLGLAGAAWATLNSFFLGVLIIYPQIFKRGWMIFSHIFNNFVEKTRSILSIALPAMTSQLLPALSSMLATYLVASHGTESVAAWGMGIRVEFFSIILVLAMTMSLPPMIGKAYGAQDFGHIALLLKLAIKSLVIWQLGLAVILWLFEAPISQALTGNPQIAEIVGWYLMYIPASYALLGVCMLLVSASNAISRPMDGLKISVARLFICYVPCMYLGSIINDLPGLMVGAAAGNILAGIVSIWMFRRAFAQAKAKRHGV